MLYKRCVVMVALLNAWAAQATVAVNGSVDGDAEAEALDQETRPQVQEGAPLCLGGGGEGDDAAELSLESGLNASGHWQAKVRLQHVAERPRRSGEQGAQSPVQLQMRRSTQRGIGDSRLITLQATLTGPSASSPPFSGRGSGSPHGPLPWSGGSSPSPACPTLPRSQESQQKSCPPAPPCPPPSPAPPCPSPCPSPCPAPPQCPSCPAPQRCLPPGISLPPCPACPSCAKPTPPGYERHAGHGAYRVHLLPLNWFDAQATCEREGAHLAVINSQEEADILARILSRYTIPYVSMGFHDLNIEGSHVTVLDTPLRSSGYLKWAKGEPNDVENEDCGGMYVKDLVLNDHQCLQTVAPFICEMP